MTEQKHDYAYGASRSDAVLGNGDSYKRRNTSADTYQCGCRWERQAGFGDVLVQCRLHQAHTEALVREFDRKRGIEVPNA
jgi:hypothetical protein